MNENISTLQARQADWQALGKLELPISADTMNELRIWLTNLLASLNLQPELLTRIIRSAVEAISFDETKLLHFFVFILKVEVSNGNWGWFRIAKAENAAEDELPPVSVIEFYIYNEV